MNKNNFAWIIGGGSGLGRKLAEVFAQQGRSVVLSSRGTRDLEANAHHIRIMYGTQAEVFPLDLAEVKDDDNANEIVSRFIALYGAPSDCYFIAGNIHGNDKQLESAKYLPFLMQVNFTGPALLINEVLRQRESQLVKIVVASSVAAIRPRSNNIAYGTAKKSLEQFCLGLMHSQADKGVTIQMIRFGYMDTNLSYGHPIPFPAASTEYIAKKIIAMDSKASGLYYLPSFWRLIAVVLQLIPFFIYKKLKF
jgi:short-subunit dehydrogenase